MTEKERALADLRSLPGFADAESWEEVVRRREQEMARGAWKDVTPQMSSKRKQKVHR